MILITDDPYKRGSSARIDPDRSRQFDSLILSVILISGDHCIFFGVMLIKNSPLEFD